MEREILQVFLRSGPTKRYDVGFHSRRAVEAGGADASLLFRAPHLNDAILLKIVPADDAAGISEEKPISTLVYIPYDPAKPGDGGESFWYSEENFLRFVQYKRKLDAYDFKELDEDVELLNVFDSVPTFSPFIIELACERAAISIPNHYLQISPELRQKLTNGLKSRIRPLVVAAYEKRRVDLERSVEDLTARLFALKDIESILPLIQALNLPHDKALEILSSWIGLSYFEYEYARIQEPLKEFAAWMSSTRAMKFSVTFQNKEHMDSLSRFVREKLKADWERIITLSTRYRSSYGALINKGDFATFSDFLMECRSAFWEMADILGRLEQTIIIWRRMQRGNVGSGVSFTALLDFYTVLRTLHSAPQRILGKDTAADNGGDLGFGTMTPDLF
jgi:hypothetical protein